jgi:hypothetical protein
MQLERLVHDLHALCLPRGPVGGEALAQQSDATEHEHPADIVEPTQPIRVHGIVASLARPGSNLTGINFFTGELVAKRSPPWGNTNRKDTATHQM